MAERQVDEGRVLAWGLCALQMVGAGLSLRYFAGAPAVLSVAAAVCLGMAGFALGPRSVRSAAWAERFLGGGCDDAHMVDRGSSAILEVGIMRFPG